MSTTTHHEQDTLVQGKQSNHGDFHLPVSIRHLGNDLPLYRAVAWWGFLHGREFTRDDISQAFQIEPRRASGILNYICHRNDEGDIAFEASTRGLRGGQRLMVIRILGVKDRPVMRRRGKQVSPPRLPGNRDRQMARWLLSRPVGNNAERLARWKAACPATISE